MGSNLPELQPKFPEARSCAFTLWVLQGLKQTTWPSTLTSKLVYIIEIFHTTMANVLKFPQTGLTYLPLSVSSLPFPSHLFLLHPSFANSLKTLPGFLSNQNLSVLRCPLLKLLFWHLPHHVGMSHLHVQLSPQLNREFREGRSPVRLRSLSFQRLQWLARHLVGAWDETHFFRESPAALWRLVLGAKAVG